MTLWRFAAALDGWRKASGATEAGASAPSEEEFDAIVAEHRRLGLLN
jgi:hypothetical protein